LFQAGPIGRAVTAKDKKVIAANTLLSGPGDVRREVYTLRVVGLGEALRSHANSGALPVPSRGSADHGLRST